MFARDFPLGVEERLTLESTDFAIAHSGLHEVRHKNNRIITVGVYLAMGLVLVAGLVYMGRALGRGPAYWSLDGTLHDPSDPLLFTKTKARTKVHARPRALPPAAALPCDDLPRRPARDPCRAPSRAPPRRCAARSRRASSPSPSR